MRSIQWTTFQIENILNFKTDIQKMSWQKTRDSIHFQDFKMDQKHLEKFEATVSEILFDIAEHKDFETRQEYLQFTNKFYFDSFTSMQKLMARIIHKIPMADPREVEREESRPRENQKVKKKKPKTSKSSQSSAKSQAVKRSKSKQPIAAINPSIKKIKTTARVALRQGPEMEYDDLNERQKRHLHKMEQVERQKIRHEEKYKNKQQSKSRGKVKGKGKGEKK